MAVTIKEKSFTGRVKLDAGNNKTVSVALPKLNSEYTDENKLMTVANLLAPCLDKTITSVETVQTKTYSGTPSE